MFQYSTIARFFFKEGVIFVETRRAALICSRPYIKMCGSFDMFSVFSLYKCINAKKQLTKLLLHVICNQLIQR